MHIPKDLLEEAVRVSGVGTQTMAVILGLEELIRRKRLEALLKYKGKGLVKLSKKDLKKMRLR
ncbi:MAG: type II toxin-antitoxin system VapB family antitoxin [Deltaproteobacteria bacterium]|nr:type II toxin-antitoxin system VapB family antitoxin [Deltaproteobacteria bacterium]